LVVNASRLIVAESDFGGEVINLIVRSTCLLSTLLDFLKLLLIDKGASSIYMVAPFF